MLYWADQMSERMLQQAIYEVEMLTYFKADNWGLVRLKDPSSIDNHVPGILRQAEVRLQEL